MRDNILAACGALRRQSASAAAEGVPRGSTRVQPGLARSVPKHVPSAALGSRKAIVDCGTIVRNREVGKELDEYGLAISGESEPKPITIERVNSTDTATPPDRTDVRIQSESQGMIQRFEALMGFRGATKSGVLGRSGVPGVSGRRVARPCCRLHAHQQLAAGVTRMTLGGSYMYRSFCVPRRSTAAEKFCVRQIQVEMMSTETPAVWLKFMRTTCKHAVGKT